MKSKLSKKLLFALTVFSLLLLFVFAASAKTVKQDGFVFDVKDGKATVVSYSGKAEKVVIPSAVSSALVTKIGVECFWQVKTMTSVSIPDSVTDIGQTAFNECTGLESIVLPKKLSSLGDAVFWYCTGLKKIVFRSDIKKLGENVFRGCGKATVYVPYASNTEKLVKSAGVTKIGYIVSKLTAPKSMKLSPGDTAALAPTVSPTDKLQSGVLSFSSDNKKVAEISSKGVIKAVGCGTAVITVKTKDGSGKSAKCTVSVVPKKPEKLKQSSNTLSSVTIKWSAASGATGYNVYRYDSAKKSWKLLSYVTKTSFTLKNLSSSEKLKLRVTSVFKDGKKSIYGGKAEIDVSSAKVSAVSGLKQSASTLSSAKISWNAVSGASKYRIQKYVASKKAWQTLTYTTKLSYTVTGLSPAEKVKLRVRVTFVENKKEYYSSNKEITVVAASPAAVSNLKKSSSTLSSVTVSWSAVKNAEKYRVSRYNTSTKKWDVVAESTKTSYKVSGLLPSESVKLRVAGLFKSGSKTVLGNTKDITVSASDVPSVKALALTSRSNNSLSFSWQACSGVDGYNIYGYNPETKKYTFKGTSATPAYSISSLKARTEYCFAVKAYVNISGSKYESKTYSPVLSVYTLLPAVKDFAADEKKVTRTTIPLSWSSCEGAQGYYVEVQKTGEEALKIFEVPGTETSFVCTSLEAATEYRLRLRAFFKAGETTVYSEYTDALTVSTYAQPETKYQALDCFAAALQNTAEQKDFRLFKTADSYSRQYLPDEEKFLGILSSIDAAEKGFFNFADGTDATTGKSVSESVPVFPKDVSFTEEDAEKYVVNFKENGNGYDLTIELPADSDLAAAFLPNIKPITNENGLNVSEISFKKLVITSKVNNNRLDSLYITCAFSAKGIENATGRTFSFGETLERKFIFNWK